MTGYESRAETSVWDDRGVQLGGLLLLLRHEHLHCLALHACRSTRLVLRNVIQADRRHVHAPLECRELVFFLSPENVAFCL